MKLVSEINLSLVRTQAAVANGALIAPDPSAWLLLQRQTAVGGLCGQLATSSGKLRKVTLHFKAIQRHYDVQILQLRNLLQ
jgi:hypothetical protein